MASNQWFAEMFKTIIKKIMYAKAQATASAAQDHTQQVQAEVPQPQPEPTSERNFLTSLGNTARDNIRRHTIPDLERAIRLFGVESYVNNVEKVKQHLTSLGIDISNAKKERLTEIGILLYREGALQPGGVLEGLLQVTEYTTVNHVRGKNPPQVNVQKALQDYLAGNAEILVISYKHVELDPTPGSVRNGLHPTLDKDHHGMSHPTLKDEHYGMSQENFDEVMSLVRRTKKKTFLWVDKVRSRGRGLKWSPDCSLMYIAFPGYQLSDIRSCDRLWITAERDSIGARESAKNDEVPALRAYAVICRNAIRGDYDNCPVYREKDAGPFIAWAKKLMGRLFVGKLQWGELDGTECFQHAAVAVLYNFTTLNVFLGSKALKTSTDKIFGPLSSLQFAHPFWPERGRQSDIEDVDVAIENAMDWYIRADDTYFHFLGRLRQGPRSTTCYRGTLLDLDGKEDFLHGVLRTGEVVNSDSVHPETLSVAFEYVWRGEDEDAFIKVLGTKDVPVRIMFESVLQGEPNVSAVTRQVFWSTKNATVVRGTHMYLY